jgi:tRNA threonylcarbamoyl adenosine modification protein YeaZ
MILIINTSLVDQMEIILAEKPENFKIKKIKGKFNQSEKLLPAIDLLLKNNKAIGKLKGIGVVVGPGGFTSVRIGVAVANALAYGFKVPVVGLRKDQFDGNNDLVAKIIKLQRSAKVSKLVMPFYDKEPNITIST